jgi:hypothetical protein
MLLIMRLRKLIRNRHWYGIPIKTKIMRSRSRKLIKCSKILANPILYLVMPRKDKDMMMELT